MKPVLIILVVISIFTSCDHTRIIGVLEDSEENIRYDSKIGRASCKAIYKNEECRAYAYNRQLLNWQFNDELISTIQITLSDGTIVISKEAEVFDKFVRVKGFESDWQDIDLQRVLEFKYTEEHPLYYRSKFLAATTIWGAFFGAMVPGSDKQLFDNKNMGIGAIIGFVMGLPELFYKKYESESILNSLNDQVAKDIEVKCK
jgi:hypothetical protein